ncbi:MAG: hypothetical protein C4297_06965 [Gemmataceae bacterium]
MDRSCYTRMTIVTAALVVGMLLKADWLDGLRESMLQAVLAQECRKPWCGPPAVPRVVEAAEVPPPVVVVHVQAPAHSDSAEVEYVILVENRSAMPAYRLTVYDRLPSNTRFVRSDPPATVQGDELQWALGTLPGSSKKQIHLTVAVTGPGDVHNCVRVTYEHGVCVTTTRPPTTPTTPAALSLQLTDSVDPVQLGEETRYDLVLRNRGQQPATDVRLIVSVPPELAIVRVQGPVDHRKEGQTIAYDPFTLPGGTETVFRISVKAIKPGKVRVRAQLSSDALPSGPVRQEEATTILEGPQ